MNLICGNGSQYMRQIGVILGHPIFISFHRLTGYQQDPRNRGVTTVVAQPPMVNTSRPVSVFPGEKREKFNGLNFKQ